MEIVDVVSSTLDVPELTYALEDVELPVPAVVELAVTEGTEAGRVDGAEAEGAEET